MPDDKGSELMRPHFDSLRVFLIFRPFVVPRQFDGLEELEVV